MRRYTHTITKNKYEVGKKKGKEKQGGKRENKRKGETPKRNGKERGGMGLGGQTCVKPITLD